MPIAVLKISEHIANCEKHPLHIALADNATLRSRLKVVEDALGWFVGDPDACVNLMGRIKELCCKVDCYECPIERGRQAIQQAGEVKG